MLGGIMIKSYYETNASKMIDHTLNLDLKPIYARFEHYLSCGDKLLDMGFGSGRDSLHFISKGYDVVAVDFAEEVVRRGKNLLNCEVLQVDVLNMAYHEEFDAIWASAIFLHYKENEILEMLERVRNALKEKGVIYLSFKEGTHEEERKGRFFNDFNEEKFNQLLNKVKGFEQREIWLTEDARENHKGRQWLNIILQKK